jgi:hypothetical protein
MFKSHPPQLSLFGEALPALSPSPSPRRSASKLAPGTCQAAESRALREAFLGLATQWELTGREALLLLGEPSESEEGRQERLSALIGMGRSLRFIDPDPRRGRQLLREPQPAFGGRSLLQAMLDGGRASIAAARAHLAEQASA